MSEWTVGARNVRRARFLWGGIIGWHFCVLAHNSQRGLKTRIRNEIDWGVEEGGGRVRVKARREVVMVAVVAVGVTMGMRGRMLGMVLIP